MFDSARRDHQVEPEYACAIINKGVGMGKKKVLLIDDDAVLCMATEAILNHMGLEVMVANNGILGAEMFVAEHQQLALVLVDVVMPDLHGFDVLRMLKKHDDTVPIVLMSARDAYANMEPFLFESRHHFLQKPFDFDGLQQIVAKHIG